MNFKTPSTLLILSTLLCPLATGSDVVTLKHGNTISGEILALGKEAISLKIPHADTPLRVKGDQLINLQFDNVKTKNLPTHSERITLVNGDVFPADITSLDSNSLKLETWFAGPLTISRDHLRSVYFGVKPQPLIYQGPNGLDGWEHDNDWIADSDNGNTLYSVDNGTIGRDLELPSNFIFNIHLEWQHSPSVRIHLCTDTTDSSEIQDSYQITFGNQGVQLRYRPSLHLNEQTLFLGEARVRPADIIKNTLALELRINRDTREIHLNIDGKPYGTYQDQSPPPAGSSVIIESRSGGQRTHEIIGVSVYQWDTITHLLHREDRVNNSSLDTVSIADGDRYSGKILAITPSLGEQGPLLNMETPLISSPLQIPAQDCSVLHFSEHPDSDESPSGNFLLALISGGTLGLDSIELGETLKARHPLLGLLNLDRRILSQINRRSATKNTSTVKD